MLFLSVSLKQSILPIGVLSLMKAHNFSSKFSSAKEWLGVSRGTFWTKSVDMFLIDRGFCQVIDFKSESNLNWHINAGLNSSNTAQLNLLLMKVWRLRKSETRQGETFISTHKIFSLCSEGHGRRHVFSFHPAASMHPATRVYSLSPSPGVP